jgi:uncharacterized membrane protein
VVPESLDSAQGLYVLGTIILVIGIVAGATGIVIRRRLEESSRDERYVREKRGEEVTPVEPRRIAGLLQYAGLAIVGIGIVVLLVGWTVAPGPA